MSLVIRDASPSEKRGNAMSAALAKEQLQYAVQIRARRVAAKRRRYGSDRRRGPGHRHELRCCAAAQSLGLGLSATKCLIRIRHPADAGIARPFHARQNGLIGTQESLKAASQEAGLPGGTRTPDL